MINATHGLAQEGSWIDALTYPNHIQHARRDVFMENKTQFETSTYGTGLAWE